MPACAGICHVEEELGRQDWSARSEVFPAVKQQWLDTTCTPV